MVIPLEPPHHTVPEGLIPQVGSLLICYSPSTTYSIENNKDQTSVLGYKTCKWIEWKTCSMTNLTLELEKKDKKPRKEPPEPARAEAKTAVEDFEALLKRLMKNWRK
uniref:Uncharacterized protein n=1 Tax=Ditylenchus dipsaci TaxID=166011 RepID=A0A915CQM4_9BILA